jgi:transposase-like protein
MSRAEDQERRLAGWLEHLRSWQTSGQGLSAYARSRGIEPGSMYYWRSALRRRNLWPQEPGEPVRERGAAVVSDPARVPLRFARVKLAQATRSSSVKVHVILSNGRRAEIELEDTQHLSEVLSALERSA